MGGREVVVVVRSVVCGFWVGPGVEVKGESASGNDLASTQREAC